MQTTKKGKIMAEKKDSLPALPTTLAIQTMDAASTIEKMAAASPDGFTVLNLDRIPFATADSYTWNVPTEDGPDPRRYLDVIVLYQHAVRQRYVGSYNPNNPTPPSCVSYNGIIGQGDPGGACARCPFNTVGPEAECRPYRWLYLLFPGEPIPMLLSLPRTSLSRRVPKGVAKYFLDLAKGGRERVKGGLWPYSVITRIGLVRRERGVGMVATFEEGPKLSPAQEEAVKEYAESFKKSITFPMLGSRRGGPDMYHGDGEFPGDDDNDVDPGCGPDIGDR